MTEARDQSSMLELGSSLLEQWLNLSQGLGRGSSLKDYEALYNSVSEISVLRLIFAQSVSIEIADRLRIAGVPLLVELASHGYWVEVNELVDRGANPFVQNDARETVLSYAVTWGDSRAFVSILSAVPALGQVDFHEGSSILGEVIAVGSADMLSAYLECFPQEHGASLVDSCRNAGRLDLVKQLLRSGQLDSSEPGS